MAKPIRFILTFALWTCFLCIFPTTNSHAAPGDLDTSFGTDGIVTTSISDGSDRGYGLAILADGKILVSGRADFSSGVGEFAVVRYNSDGTLDTSFGTDGIVTTSISDGDDSGYELAIQADGKILVSGIADLYTLDDTGDFAVVRYSSDGTLDTSFGTDGIVTTGISDGNDESYGLAILADGKILVSGNADISSGIGDFAVVRYNSDGSLDTSFGTDGIVTTSISNGNDKSYGLAIQTDGKVSA